MANRIEVPTRGEQVIRDTISKLESYARGMWRYRWSAVITMWLVSLGGWTFVYLMPPVYEANARIYVDTENAIRPLLQGIAATTNVMNEVTVVTREMLSRPNLAQVAHDTDLDLRAKSDAAFEQLLNSLRERIEVVGNRDNIFTIAYRDRDRDKAVAVVDSLVNTFVEKSLGANRTDSTSAQAFLQTQIGEYEARLTEAENRLADFKRTNVAFMPDQQGDYFARLQAAKTAFEASQSKLQLAIQRRAELLRQLEGEEPVFGIMSSNQGDVDHGSGYTSSKIRQLEQELEELRLQYTDKHPRITQILETIQLLKAQEAEEAQAEFKQRAAAPPGNPGASSPLELNPVYQNMRIQLSNTDVEIATYRAEVSQQQERVSELQRMVDTVPQVEAELARLNRDYDVVKSKYEQLLAQLETANIGEDVEASINEVQFRIIDPPFADRRPIGPKRQLFISAILMIAVSAAGALAFLLDQLHPVFFSPRDITRVTGLPVLGSVSLLMTPSERSAKFRSRFKFGLAVAALLGVYACTVLLAGILSPVFRSLLGMDA